MADLTASGTTPAVIWDIDAASNDWRLIADSTTMSVERYAGGEWVRFFEWSASGVTKMRAAVPALIFEDTDSGHDDFRILVDSDDLFIQVDSGSGYDAILQMTMSW